MSEIINLETEKMIKNIKEQTGITKENSNIVNAINESIERQKMYDLHDSLAEKELLTKGIQPQQCHNEVCTNNDSGICNMTNPKPVGCMYRMITSPPISLDYNEYMPTHKEALDMLEKNGLLKGDREEYLKASADYGKARNQSERWNHEVSGIDFNILEKCIHTAIKEHFDFIKNEYNVDLEDNVDISVLARNACIEVEQAMGIYPNIKMYK